MLSMSFVLRTSCSLMASLLFSEHWVIPFLCLAGCLCYCLYFRWRLRPLPPGPSVSWFGLLPNTCELPSSYAWLTFAQWQRVFGDMIYFNVFGNRLLVLNSASAAQDLLERRSAIYSSRPVRTMQTELMGFNYVFSGMPYGSQFRQHRALFQKYFQPKSIVQYHHILFKHSLIFLRNILRTSGTLDHHLRRTSAAIIMEICYGHHVADEGDEYVTLADEALIGITQGGLFGSFMVDYIPILKHVPSWMPGAEFKRKALEWRKVAEKMLNYPFDKVREKVEKGTAEACVMTRELEDWLINDNKDGHRESLVKSVTATAYAAAVDTTMSTLASFFLAMVLHPEVQALAQAEIDQHVPSERLPTFSDRNGLPFINCIVWETLRWNPAVNIALAHLVTENDEYRGYRVPKGTTVLANIWTILHDPERYPDPMAFKPQRFSRPQENLEKGINPIPESAYGFGRRVCPGRFLALDTIWIVIATVLSVYTVTKACDESGREIEPEVAYTPGLISRPKPFLYRLIPRSEKSLALIEMDYHD